MNMEYEKLMEEALVPAALQAAGGEVQEGEAGRWPFAMYNGNRFEGTAALDGTWLALDVPMDPGADDEVTLWNHVLINGQLDHDCRVARWGSDAALRSDMHIATLHPVDERIAWACEGLRNAHDILADGGRKGGSDEDVATSPEQRAFLEQSCRDAGWEPVAAADNTTQVRVDLDVRHGPHRAELALLPSGAIRAEVTAHRMATDKLTTASRAALAVLLLRASAVVRMTRGFARTRGSRTIMGFGVTCAPTAAMTAELAHALSALSVVCGLCSSEEIEVLTNEAMAALFLRAQGIGSRVTGKRKKKTRKPRKEVT